MRISLVSEHASPLAVLGGTDAGGQNVHVAALAAALARLGHEVSVATRRDAPDLPSRQQTTDGYEVHHVAAGPPRPVSKDDLLPHMSAFGQALAREWRRQRPEVVHAHFWMSGLAARPVAASLGVPLVQTFHALGVVKRRHQGASDPSPPARLAIEQSLATRADRIIATCRDEVRELVALGVRAEQVSVIPCGVDLARFTPAGPVAGRTTRRHRLVCLGRLVPRKGYDQVISALPDLPDTELVIAGGQPEDEEEHDRLLRLASRLGVGDRVQLVGPVPRLEVPALLRSADVVVCVPWYEPFGIVPLEAMACGVPVVAAAVGGFTDTVVPGRTGALVPPRDTAALAAALAGLLANSQRRRRMGQAGRRRVEHSYSWELVGRRTADVYAELVHAHSTPLPTSSTLTGAR